MSMAKSTLVSRSAATSAMGARVKAQMRDPIGAERHRAGRESAPPGRQEPRQGVLAARLQRKDEHPEPVAHEHPQREAGGGAGEPRADPVHQCVGGGEGRRAERPGERLARGRRACRAAAAPLRGHQHDAEADRRHGQRLAQGRRLAEERCADQGDDERRGAPGERVHLAEVAVFVGADEEQLVAGVQQRRRGEPGPGRRGRQREEGQQRQGEPALDEGEQQHGGESVEADLHHRVPARMHQRRREHGGEDGMIHSQPIRAVSTLAMLPAAPTVRAPRSPGRSAR